MLLPLHRLRLPAVLGTTVWALLLSAPIGCTDGDEEIPGARSDERDQRDQGEVDDLPPPPPDAVTLERDIEFDPDHAVGIGDRFQGLVESRHPPGTRGVKRAVFLKPHACARARFELAPNRPESHRVGLFGDLRRAPDPADAWVRFSSDTTPTTSDLDNSTVGMAIKVLGVEGDKVLAGEEDGQTHDFLLQNHHVFFVDTAADFLAFTVAIFSGKVPEYLEAHPTTAKILDAMKKPVANVLSTRYFSTTPYRFGHWNHAKYSVKPCLAGPAEEAPKPEQKNYLRERLERDLLVGEACFELQVQLRREGMPLDRATVEWSEDVEPPQTVAFIHLLQQDINDNEEVCENFSFTAWHALPDHRPVGSVNEARGIVYKRLADFRRKRNGVSIEEPVVEDDDADETGADEAEEE